MEYSDLVNLDHDPDLATALGNMVIAWARAESAIVMAYGLTLDVHYNVAAAAYYNIPTFESRTKALLATINDRPDPFPKRDKLRDAVTGLVNLVKTRNTWVHGTWVANKKTSVTHVFNMKQPSTTRRATQVTANAVRQHVMAVQGRTEDLMELVPTKIAAHT